MNKSGYTPLLSHVLVLPDNAEEVTEGGIIKPQQTRDRDSLSVTKGVIVAIGPSAWDVHGDGTRQAKVGDNVLFKQYAGVNYIGEDDQKYWLMHDEDILGKANGRK